MDTLVKTQVVLKISMEGRVMIIETRILDMYTATNLAINNADFSKPDSKLLHTNQAHHYHK